VECNVGRHRAPLVSLSGVQTEKIALSYPRPPPPPSPLLRGWKRAGLSPLHSLHHCSSSTPSCSPPLPLCSALLRSTPLPSILLSDDHVFRSPLHSPPLPTHHSRTRQVVARFAQSAVMRLMTRALVYPSRLRFFLPYPGMGSVEISLPFSVHTAKQKRPSSNESNHIATGWTFCVAQPLHIVT
jgi:hypothetical protein